MNTKSIQTLSIIVTKQEKNENENLLYFSHGLDTSFNRIEREKKRKTYEFYERAHFFMSLPYDDRKNYEKTTTACWIFFTQQKINYFEHISYFGSY